MDIKDLRYFTAVFEARSFSRAAEQLDTVQSNVSMRIRNLESHLAVTLFERGYRTLAPTLKGETLYGHAKQVIELLDRTEQSLRLHQEPAAAPAVVTKGPVASRGFTLLELLVVVVIIGLLAGYVAPKYFSQVGKSEVQVAKAQIDAFDKALDQYRLDTRRYPTTEQGLKALVERPASEPQWAGPYLRKAVPLDPWGHAYIYRTPGTKGDYDLVSYGKDGQPGGTGENADIANY